jgi:hypothetical protein
MSKQLQVMAQHTNRQAATAASVFYQGALSLGACPVLQQAYMVSKIDKMRMNMNGSGVLDDSSGASASSAPSAASAMQVRLLV